MVPSTGTWLKRFSSRAVCNAAKSWCRHTNVLKCVFGPLTKRKRSVAVSFKDARSVAYCGVWGTSGDEASNVGSDICVEVRCAIMFSVMFLTSQANFSNSELEFIVEVDFSI